MPPFGSTAHTFTNFLAFGAYGQLILGVPDLHLVVAVSARDSGPIDDLFDDIFSPIDEVVIAPFA